MAADEAADALSALNLDRPWPLHQLPPRESPAEVCESIPSRQGKMALDKVPYNEVFHVLALGMQDKDCVLSKLSPDLLRKIMREWWLFHISFGRGGQNGVFVSKVGDVKFPPPTGVQVNMIPILIGDPAYDTTDAFEDDDDANDTEDEEYDSEDEEYDSESDEVCERYYRGTIPRNLRQYLPLLRACPAWVSRHDRHKIGYLTVHESLVEPGQSQRRGGLHSETPGLLQPRPGAQGGAWSETGPGCCDSVFWGEGYADPSDGTSNMYHGGIYMASTVSGSTRVWDAQVATAVIGDLGDLEHVRDALGSGVELQAGELVWMTDTTPHESVPLPAGTYRQYFRLVTAGVSVWYAHHSTPNPLNVRLPKEVRVIEGDKFAPAASECQ